MTAVSLLDTMKVESKIATADLLLPVAMQKGDKEQPPDRAADIYLMRLPFSSEAKKKVPYILHQFITGEDFQEEGEPDTSRAVIRSIFAVYNEDEQAGGLALLNLMERLRIHLLRQVVIGGKFELDKKAKLERIVYPSEDTAPYHIGEMVSTWILPPVEREVAKFL